MDILNEPEILSNIKRRYKADKIFTKIGPTLIVVNPYKIIEPLFNHKVHYTLVRNWRNSLGR